MCNFVSLLSLYVLDSFICFRWLLIYTSACSGWMVLWTIVNFSDFFMKIFEVWFWFSSQKSPLGLMSYRSNACNLLCSHARPGPVWRHIYIIWKRCIYTKYITLVWTILPYRPKNDACAMFVAGWNSTQVYSPGLMLTRVACTHA